MVLCLGEASRRFLLLMFFISFLIFILSLFVIFFIHILLFDIIPHPSVVYRQVFTHILYFEPSPSQSDSRHFHFQPFRYLLTGSATVLSGRFYPQAFFTLRYFTNIFDSTCVYEGFPGSWQFFLEVCRASY